MKIYVGLSGLLGASEEDANKVFDAALRLVFSYLHLYASHSESTVDPILSTLAKHKIALLPINSSQKQEFIRQLHERDFITLTTHSIPVKSLVLPSIKISVSFDPLRMTLTRYGDSIDIGGSYNEDDSLIELNLPYPTDLLDLGDHADNTTVFDDLVGTLRSVLRHEMAHGVQGKHPYKKFYQSLYLKPNSPARQNLHKDFGRTLRSAWKTYFKDMTQDAYGNAERKRQFLLYVMRSVEIGPWVYTELERFRQMLAQNNLTGSRALAFKKHFLSINEPAVSLSELIDLMKTEPGDHYDLDEDNDYPLAHKSLFFLALKTLKPLEYRYLVKQFEAALNLGRYR